MLKEKASHLAAGREAPFYTMSRRPGIGYPAIPAITSTFTDTTWGALALGRAKDVPVALQAGDRPLPLGPYLRQKLRLELFGDHHQPLESKQLSYDVARYEAWLQVPDVLKNPETDSGFRALSHAISQIQGENLKKKNLTRSVRAKQLAARYQLTKQRKKL